MAVCACEIAVVQVLHDASCEYSGDASLVATSDAYQVDRHDGSSYHHLMATGTCSWCRELLNTTARRDSRFCSQRCRQAAHRFHRAVARDVEHDGSRPMHFAYADPPYPGLSKRYYGEHPDFAGEVDHAALLEQLSSPGRYDGWALSTSAAALPEVLSLCARATDRPVRVAAWIRGGRPHKTARGPLSSWEPVIYCGGRHGGTRFDSLIYAARPRTTDPARVVGAKSATFARWMFDLLGAQPGDELDDLFPGSGGIARAWDLFVTSCSTRRVVEDLHDASLWDPHDVSPGPAETDLSPEYSHDASLPGADASLVDDGHGSEQSRLAAAQHDASAAA